MKVILTNDGYNSLYLEELDEHYHSIHGAFNESMHVFIENGLKYFQDKKTSVSILEMGFGTGLNAILTYLESNIDVNYVSIEKNPLQLSILSQLNYKNKIKGADLVFDKIHDLTWGNQHKLSDRFLFKKIEMDLLKFKTSQKFDVIYYDAFAPRVQSELWTVEIFSKCYDLLNYDGCLVTYCAKGQVKRNLKSCGFHVETLPGPPGKREMIRAIKNKLN